MCVCVFTHVHACVHVGVQGSPQLSFEGSHDPYSAMVKGPGNPVNILKGRNTIKQCLKVCDCCIYFSFSIMHSKHSLRFMLKGVHLQSHTHTLALAHTHTHTYTHTHIHSLTHLQSLRCKRLMFCIINS